MHDMKFFVGDKYWLLKNKTLFLNKLYMFLKLLWNVG